MPVVPPVEGMRGEPADERLLDLDRELNRLPETYRAPIVLCGLEGMTHQQAAEQLRWPIGTLSGRLSRGRAMLARRLSRRGPASSIGSFEMMLAHDVASVRVPSPVLSSTIRAVISGAASPSPDAGLISSKVTSLAEEVIRSMMMIKFTAIAVATGLALGLCGIAGAVVGL
jgi:Sigma-70, region 4